MAFLNLKYGLLIYEDADNPKNPLVRLPDITQDVQGVSVDFDKSERISLYPDETKDIATTERALLWDATTSLQIDRPTVNEDIIRLLWDGTGTAPSFRTSRSIGGGIDTEVSITRLNNYVARIQNTAGTAWSLTTVQIGDTVKFARSTDSLTSPFSATNQNVEYKVQDSGTDYIDVVDNGMIGLETVVLGADFADVFKVFSAGPIKKGDILQIEGASIHPSNRGKYEVLDVTDNFIEFVNPLGVTDSFLLGSNTIVAYEYLIGFVHIRATAPFNIKFGNQTDFVRIDRLGSQAIFIGSACTHKIQANNDGTTPLTITIQHAQVSN